MASPMVLMRATRLVPPIAGQGTHRTPTRCSHRTAPESAIGALHIRQGARALLAQNARHPWPPAESAVQHTVGTFWAAGRRPAEGRSVAPIAESVAVPLGGRQPLHGTIGAGRWARWYTILSQWPTDAGRRTEVASPEGLAERAAPLLPPGSGVRHAFICQTAPHFGFFVVN